MNKKIGLYIVVANLILILALTFFLPQSMIAPGKLMDAHSALETDCFACHTPWLGSRPERCVVCHEPADIGLVTTKGVAIGNEQKLVPFHQDLVETDCVACHSDHRGVQAFRPIGQFSHDLLQARVGEQCSGCHRGPSDELHRQIDGNCGQCHGQQAWTPASFDHDQLFLLDRDHRTTCNTCHVGNDYSRYTCYGCHEHSRSGIREEHIEEGIYQYENCVECHRSGDDDEVEHGRRGWSERKVMDRSGNSLRAGRAEERSRWGHHDDDDDEDDDDD